MKISLVYTSGGTLIPETDYDADLKKHLHPGKTYVADIKLKRNSDHHRMYFAMINTAWEFLPEKTQKYFHNSIESFRKFVEITAGHSEVYFNPKLGDWVEGPKSIAFDKMDQAEFEDLYMRVRAVLDPLMHRYMSTEEFNGLFLKF